MWVVLVYIQAYASEIEDRDCLWRAAVVPFLGQWNQSQNSKEGQGK